MPYDFANDSRCISLWRFESGNLTADSKGSNSLSVYGSPSADTSQYREGSASLYLNGWSALYRNDSDLSSDFPLKSTDTTKKATICFWWRPTGNREYAKIFSKWDWYGLKRSFAIQPGNAVYSGGIDWGYAADNTAFFSFNRTLPLNVWYHFSVRLDGVNKILNVVIFNRSTEETYVYDFEPANPLWVGDAPLIIGSEVNWYNCIIGLLDELAVFNDILSDQDITAIRKGNDQDLVRVFSAGSGLIYNSASGVKVSSAGSTVIYDSASGVKVSSVASAVIYLDYVQSLTISPTGIGGEETFGSPLVYNAVGTTIRPGSISSQESLANPSLSLTIFPEGADSSELFGDSRLVHIVSIVDGIEDASGVGVPHLLTPLRLTGIPATEDFGTARIKLFITPRPLISKEAIGYCNIVSAPINISPSPIGSRENFGYPSLHLSNKIRPASIHSQEAFGTAHLKGFILPQGFDATGGWLDSGWFEAPGWFMGSDVGTPRLVQLVNVQGLESAESLNGPMVVLKDPRVSRVSISSAETFGIPTLQCGPVQIQAEGVASEEDCGVPRLRQFDTVFPVGIPSESEFGVPNFFCHAVYLYPTGIPTASICSRPTINRQYELSFDLQLVTDRRGGYQPLPYQDRRQLRLPLYL